MQVGDPKKAVVLGVVALVVISVAVFRVLPSGPPPRAVASSANANPGREPSASAPTAAEVTPETTPEAPMGTANPFEHAGLNAKHASEAGTSENASSDNQGSGDAKGTAKAARQSIAGRQKSLPSAGDNGGQNSDTDPGTAPANPFGGSKQVSKPGEEDSGALPDLTAQKTTVRLLAIVSLSAPAALVSINGSPGFRGYAGTTFNDIRIHQVETGLVVIQRGKSKRTLRVGQEVTL